MNILMAALTVQMALYAVGWFSVGWFFRIKTAASMTWGWAWLCGTLGTALLYLQPTHFGAADVMLVNIFVVLAFVLLHRGIAIFMGSAAPRWVAPASMSIVFLIELVRWATPAHVALHEWLFVMAVAAPLVLTTHAMAMRLQLWNGAQPYNFVLLALPTGLTLVLFVLRALALSFSEVTGQTSLDTGTPFDIFVVLAFFVLLGMFNFSLYSMALGALVRRLEDLASTDQLTGLHNRRFVMERLAEEHARFQRSGQSYALIMMDLDHFKSINDTHGHAAGDDVLREVAQRLRQSMRSTDTLARMGGEEFLLLLPMNDIDGALVHAGRIRKRIAAAPIRSGTVDIPVTMSLGVAEVFTSDSAADAVVSRADAALYRAKTAGRNRVEMAQRATMPDPHA